jgi:hypothetical protein
MRDMATVEKNKATMEVSPEMAEPRRPQQARKPEKKARISKKRVMRMRTQPKRHRNQNLVEVVWSACPPTS